MVFYRVFLRFVIGISGRFIAWRAEARGARQERFSLQERELLDLGLVDSRGRPELGPVGESVLLLQLGGQAKGPILVDPGQDPRRPECTQRLQSKVRRGGAKIQDPGRVPLDVDLFLLI